MYHKYAFVSTMKRQSVRIVDFLACKKNRQKSKKIEWKDNAECDIIGAAGQLFHRKETELRLEFAAKGRQTPKGNYESKELRRSKAIIS